MGGRHVFNVTSASKGFLYASKPFVKRKVIRRADSWLESVHTGHSIRQEPVALVTVPSDIHFMLMDKPRSMPEEFVDSRDSCN